MSRKWHWNAAEIYTLTFQCEIRILSQAVSSSECANEYEKQKQIKKPNNSKQPKR